MTEPQCASGGAQDGCSYIVDDNLNYLYHFREAGRGWEEGEEGLH